MKNTVKILLSASLIASITASATEIMQQDLATNVPNISNNALQQLILKNRYGQTSKTTTSYRYGVIKNQIGRIKFSIQKIMHTFQEMHNRAFPKRQIFVISQKTNVYMTANQYYNLLSHERIDNFLSALNRFSQLNFVLSKFKHKKITIIYIKKEQQDYANRMTIPSYVLFVKNSNFPLYSNKSCECKQCSNFEKAFLYYRKYKGDLGGTENFNLTPVQLMELYMKLYRWNIMRLPNVRNKLLNIFVERTRYIKNFNFKMAYNRLNNNPSYEAALAIKNSLLNLKKYRYHHVAQGTFLYSKPEQLSKILNQISNITCSKYTIAKKYSPNLTIPLKVNQSVTISNFKNFKAYLKKYTGYEARVITNKYIECSPKKVLIFNNLNPDYQQMHYLDKAIQIVNKVNNQNFSKESFIENVNYIKGLLNNEK